MVQRLLLALAGVSLRRLVRVETLRVRSLLHWHRLRHFVLVDIRSFFLVLIILFLLNTLLMLRKDLLRRALVETWVSSFVPCVETYLHFRQVLLDKPDLVLLANDVLEKRDL